MKSRLLVPTAFQLAAEAHVGQLDKTGNPYLEHVVRVWRLVASIDPDPRTQVAALLHDVVEDTHVTLDDLVIFGTDTVLDVAALTKHRGEKRLNYLHRAKSRPRSLLVKLCDNMDNTNPQRVLGLMLHDPETAGRLAERYASDREILTGGIALPWP